MNIRATLVRIVLVTGLLVVSLALPPVSVRAGTFTVNTTDDDTDYDCLDGDCSLRAAIETSGAGDTILFAAGMSGQTITLKVGQLDIHHDLTIDASALPARVTVSGNNAFRVIAGHGPLAVTLRGLNIVRGKPPTDGFGGAGIYNEGDLTLTGCDVSFNTTDGNGGGIRNNNGTLRLDGGSQVTHNSGSYGGGIRNDAGGMVEVVDSVISDNHAEFGGGIDNYAGSLAMTATTLAGNSATNYGGALTTTAPATITDSVFRDNRAQSGGAIDSHEAGVLLTLSGCAFMGNKAEVDGGALLNNLTTVIATRCVFEENTADTSGGAVRNFEAGNATFDDCAFTGNRASVEGAGWGGAIENNGTLELNRSTFAGNEAGINGGAMENWDGAVTVTDCTFTGNTANNGGAINNNGAGTLTVQSSTFDANTALEGGGGAFFNDNESELTLENCTLSDNSATYEGGGIFNVWGTVSVYNSTLAGNAAMFGDGINNQHTEPNAAILNYRNTAINSAEAADCVNTGTIGENTHNLVTDGSCAAAFSGDARLGALQDNGGPTLTRDLRFDSPALDAGDDATCAAADQRAVTRPVDGDGDGSATCDIGAFESGVLRCGIQAAAEPADYTFPNGVKVQVTNDGPDLDCLLVTEFARNHPMAPEALRTLSYWQVRGLAADRETPANAGYTVALTLPYGSADGGSSVCRYGDAAWDCSAASYVPNQSVTRTSIDALSEWTVSADPCEAPAVPGPAIALAGTGSYVVRLSWEDDPANVGGYHVYRSAEPYFPPGAGTLLAAPPAGSELYNDARGAGAAGTSFAYIVAGVSNCGAVSEHDWRYGVFTFGLTPEA